MVIFKKVYFNRFILI